MIFYHLHSVNIRELFEYYTDDELALELAGLIEKLLSGIKTNTSVDYAEKRTRDHISRFNGIYFQIVENRLEPNWISELEWKDNIFPEIDYHAYASVNRKARAGAVYTSDN